MAKKQIKIRFQNGINFQIALTEVLNVVTDQFDFIESDEPDFILFAPYGNDIPKPGPYVRIGYFCENIKPDMESCEWAFGVPLEKEVNDDRYKRIQWHGLDPNELVKKTFDAETVLASKTRFCNFLYSHHVPYREEFFKQLSKYKRIDAPGKSMNNTPAIDGIVSDKWVTKRTFLSQYKFTIAFENYVYPGYQTEKLYDAMRSNSIPIYCGDPNIGDIFNTRSFVNASDHLTLNYSATVRFLERTSQPDLTDIRPSYFKSPKNRLQRKLKAIGRDLKMRSQFNKLDFNELIERVIELDKAPEKYVAMLNEPWFRHNEVPADTSLRDHWIQIFSLNGT